MKIINVFNKKRKKKKLEKQYVTYRNNVINNVNECGTNLIVYGETEILLGKNINIGRNCKINADVLMNGRSGITIGDNVTISHGVKIVSAGYDINHWISTGERKHFNDRPINIGNNCWIGTNAIILPGVNISGEYVVIGAGSVVTKNITESKVIVAGNPAKIVKRLGE